MSIIIITKRDTLLYFTYTLRAHAGKVFLTLTILANVELSTKIIFSSTP